MYVEMFLEIVLFSVIILWYLNNRNIDFEFFIEKIFLPIISLDKSIPPNNASYWESKLPRNFAKYEKTENKNKKPLMIQFHIHLLNGIK